MIAIDTYKQNDAEFLRQQKEIKKVAENFFLQSDLTYEAMPVYSPFMNLLALCRNSGTHKTLKREGREISVYSCE